MDPFEHLKYDKYLMAVKAKIQKEGSKAALSSNREIHFEQSSSSCPWIAGNKFQIFVQNVLAMFPVLLMGKFFVSLIQRKLPMIKQLRKKSWRNIKQVWKKAELPRATQELRLKAETPDPPEFLRSFPSLVLQDIAKEPIPVATEVITLNFWFSHLKVNNKTPVKCRLGISMESKFCSMNSLRMMLFTLKSCSTWAQ